MNTHEMKGKNDCLLFAIITSSRPCLWCLQLHQNESNQSRDRCGERICLNNGEARVDDRVPIVLNCIHGAERCDQGAATERFGTESARSLVTERRQRGLTKVGTECSMWGGQRIDRDKNASWETKSSALTTFHRCILTRHHIGGNQKGDSEEKGLLNLKFNSIQQLLYWGMIQTRICAGNIVFILFFRAQKRPKTSTLWATSPFHLGDPNWINS